MKTWENEQTKSFLVKFEKVKVNFTMKILCCRIQTSSHLSSAGRATDL